MRKAFPSKSTASGGICRPSPPLLTPRDPRRPMSARRKGGTPAGARPADAVSHPALLSGTWSRVAWSAQVSSLLLSPCRGTVPAAQPLKSQPFLCGSLCTPGLITPGRRGSFWPGLYFNLSYVKIFPRIPPAATHGIWVSCHRFLPPSPVSSLPFPSPLPSTPSSPLPRLLPQGVPQLICQSLNEPHLD